MSKLIFLICPVAKVTEQEHVRIAAYVAQLEGVGVSVYWPMRDTDQKDPVGLRICMDNRDVIHDCDEVHVWWNSTSRGSILDLGMAFMV